ncbi:MAG: arsenate reductase ArsC [Acidobacteriota bacterium]|nr:arsenate reductase ArsC [Blastocatellia bacterium]MDW8411936.1 arsenate reductase ArsC [Acidobacteriota bacterium]
MKRVLILCTANSARSQMAEGLLRSLTDGNLEVHSAGTRPGSVHPLAIAAMADLGIDISSHRSKSVDEFLGKDFDVMITVCDSARQECPFFPAKQVLHWSFEDPAAVTGTDAERLAAFKQVRDQIKHRLEEFIRSLG